MYTYHWQRQCSCYRRTFIHPTDPRTGRPVSAALQSRKTTGHSDRARATRLRVVDELVVLRRSLDVLRSLAALPGVELSDDLGTNAVELLLREDA